MGLENEKTGGTLCVRAKDDTELFSVKLISHFTTIYGVNSGEGKSWLFDLLIRMRAANEIKITCENGIGGFYDVLFASLDSFQELLEQDGRKVIIVDEIFINKSSGLLKLINTCKHLLVVITRSFPMAANSPLNGIYTVTLEQSGKFRLELINKNELLPVTRSLKNADIFITESAENKSEYQVLQFLIKKFKQNVMLVAARGKDKIQSKLLYCTREFPKKRIVVFTDLYNISAQLKLLIKRCKQNSNIAFYDYGCFEELLCLSNLIKKVPRNFEEEGIDFITLERFFEEKAYFLTKGTVFEFNHRKPILTECYLQECIDCIHPCEFQVKNKLNALLDSDVAAPIYRHFCSSNKAPKGDMQRTDLKSVDCFK